MAAAVGMTLGSGAPSLCLKMRNRSRRVGFISASRGDPYDTLSVGRDASESEVRKAFRRLALRYHPDVCKGDNCSVQFYEINEAYDVVMSSLREEATIEEEEEERRYDETEEGFRGMHDTEWDMWEEWMGWEGAGIRDYTSHINPYI